MVEHRKLHRRIPPSVSYLQNICWLGAPDNGLDLRQYSDLQSVPASSVSIAWLSADCLHVETGSRYSSHMISVVVVKFGAIPDRHLGFDWLVESE
jgi:hypothetical protein